MSFEQIGWTYLMDALPHGARAQWPHLQGDTPPPQDGSDPYETFDLLRNAITHPSDRSRDFEKQIALYIEPDDGCDDRLDFSTLVCECARHGEEQMLKDLLAHDPVGSLKIAGGMSGDAWRTLAGAMPEASSIRNLRVDHLALGAAECTHLFEVMDRMPELISLSLFCVDVEANALSGLPDGQRLQRQLSLTVHGGENVHLLLLEILERAALESLDFGAQLMVVAPHLAIGDETPGRGVSAGSAGVEAQLLVARALARQTHIKSLCWHCITMSNEVCNLLIRVCEEGRVSRFSLIGCAFSDAPLEDDEDGMRVVRSVNGVGDVKALELPKLMDLSHLCSLEFKGTSIPECALVSMLMKLGSNTSLTSLDLRSTGAGLRFFQTLSDALEHNGTLLDFSVHWSAAEAELLVKGMEKNLSLQRVFIEGISNANPLYQRIEECIKRNDARREARRTEEIHHAFASGAMAWFMASVSSSFGLMKVPPEVAAISATAAYDQAPKSAMTLAYVNKEALKRAEEAQQAWLDREAGGRKW